MTPGCRTSALPLLSQRFSFTAINIERDEIHHCISHQFSPAWVVELQDNAGRSWRTWGSKERKQRTRGFRSCSFLTFSLFSYMRKLRQMSYVTCSRYIRLEQLKFNVHMKSLRILLQCRFWFCRTGLGPRSLHFLTYSQVKLILLA